MKGTWFLKPLHRSNTLHGNCIMAQEFEFVITIGSQKVVEGKLLANHKGDYKGAYKEMMRGL